MYGNKYIHRFWGLGCDILVGGHYSVCHSYVPVTDKRIQFIWDKQKEYY